MTRTACPVANDLKQILQASGIVPDPPADEDMLGDFTAQVLAAAADWEQDTGLVPFVKDASDVTYYYDPPGHSGGSGLWGSSRGGSRRLYLPAQGGSVWASITSVTVGYSTSNPGTVLTAGTDYSLEPRNAVLAGRPYEWIVFLVREFGTGGSIAVTGKRGWPSFPENAWRAVLKRAASKMAATLAARVSGGLQSWRTGTGTSETYGDKGPYAQQISEWDAEYWDAVGKFKVVEL